ncbi:MAG: beta-N-acetylhexosaminidase [Sphaerochaeta sp.]|nr:beta-N-acetylhexosaminidase [Sphaerochaeta sp.]
MSTITDVERMSLREMVGQHLVCGFAKPQLDDQFREAVRAHKIANVILFAHNIESKEQLYALTAEIQALVKAECNTTALIGIDQEGGMITRLSPDCTNVPGAMAIAASGNPKNAYDAGFLTATELRALGVNVDFAPSVDVNSNANNPVIGVRSYGDTAKTVITYTSQMIKGLQTGGVVATAKHFPGHGDTHLDTHVALPVVEGDRAHLEEHLAPFKAAVEGGVQAVMSSHILFPALEKDAVPATMSRAIITGLLKEEMGFKGLVFTDCLEMDAIARHYGTVEGAVAALAAGIDLACISHHVEIGVAAVEAIEAAIEEGRIDLDELKASTAKILDAKAMLEGFERPPLSVVDSPVHRALNLRLHQETITVVNDAPFTLTDRPLFIGPRLFRTTNTAKGADETTFSRLMGERFDSPYIISPDNPVESEIEEIVAQAKDATTVVLATYNGHLNRGQIDLVNRFAGSNALCIALRNPYDLALVDTRIRTVACYSFTAVMADVLERLLTGEYSAEGKLPIGLGGLHA